MAELRERYAGALFELSMESGMPKEHLNQAVFVRDVLSDKDADAFLRHPHVPDRAKRDLFQKLFSGKISSDLMGFLYLAVAKNREALIVPSLTAYIEMIHRHQGKMTANVVSAVPLSEKQIDTLRALLSRKLEKSVDMVIKTDPSLIGGFYIHMEGRLIDCTVRTQLNKIKENIKGGMPNDRQT